MANSLHCPCPLLVGRSASARENGVEKGLAIERTIRGRGGAGMGTGVGRRVKHWSNTGQTLVKHWSNTGQTLVKHCSLCLMVRGGIYGDSGRLLFREIREIQGDIYRLFPPAPTSPPSATAFDVFDPFFSVLTRIRPVLTS